MGASRLGGKHQRLEVSGARLTYADVRAKSHFYAKIAAVRSDVRAKLHFCAKVAAVQRMKGDKRQATHNHTNLEA
jgi:hypothetical protein